MIQFNMMRFNSIQCNKMQFNAIQCNKMLPFNIQIVNVYEIIIKFFYSNKFYCLLYNLFYLQPNKPIAIKIILFAIDFHLINSLKTK